MLFGLSPNSADNANSLIYHSAQQGYANIMGYSWGNEQTGDSKFAANYKAGVTQVCGWFWFVGTASMKYVSSWMDFWCHTQLAVEVDRLIS